MIDLSLIFWSLLSAITLGLAGILFINPYKTAIQTEMYIKYRRLAIENGLKYSEELNDKYLDLDLLQKQMEEDVVKNGGNPDIVNYKSAFTVSAPENANGKINKNGIFNKKGGDEQ